MIDTTAETLAAGNAATIPEMLQEFERFKGCSVRVNSPDTPLVEGDGVAFLVWDNGGEIGVSKVNSGEIPRFFPTTHFEEALDAETLAYRLRQVVLGRLIDFEYRGL